MKTTNLNQFVVCSRFSVSILFLFTAIVFSYQITLCFRGKTAKAPASASKMTLSAADQMVHRLQHVWKSDHPVLFRSIRIQFENLNTLERNGVNWILIWARREKKNREENLHLSTLSSNTQLWIKQNKTNLKEKWVQQWERMEQF